MINAPLIIPTIFLSAMGARTSKVNNANEKVDPNEAYDYTNGPFLFRTAVSTTPPMVAWPQEFLQRRHSVKQARVVLTSGRQICYFEEGGVDCPVILCLHGLMQSKFLFLLPEPLLTVRMIAIDRFGYGCSSSEPPNGIVDQTYSTEAIIAK